MSTWTSNWRAVSSTSACWTRPPRPSWSWSDGVTPAAWTGSIITGVGSLLAAVAFVLPGGISWPLMWAGLVVVLLGPVVGLVMRNMGYGTREL